MSRSTVGQQLVLETRRQFYRGVLFAAVLSAFINLTILISPLFMLLTYGHVVPSRSYDTLYGLLLIAGLMVAIYGILEFCRSYTYEVMARGFIKRLNLLAVQAGVMKSIEGGLREGVQVLHDLADLRSFIAGNAISTPLEALWSPIFIVALYILHPVFGHVAVAFVVVVALLNVYTDRVTRQPIKDANEAASRHVSEIAGALRFAEVIEAMGMLPALVRHWRGSQETMMALSELANMRARLLLSITKSLYLAIQIVVVAVAAVLLLADEIPAGSMIVAMVLANKAIAPFASMIETWRQWVTAMAAWKRVKAVVTDINSQRQSMPVTAIEGRLSVEGLTYVPPGRELPVLRNVSFAVEPGEVVGIVGPSGAGKSTLARALVGVIRPTKGGVYLDGTNTFLWERGSFGQVIGYLPQSVSVLDGTVREVIARMQDSDPRDVLKAARQAGVHDLIGQLPFGYDTPIEEGIHMLSGGQLQRLALARALYGDPRLIILDEPNSNLDNIGERALMDAVRAAKARGAMVIMIAHRPSVMACADKLLVLQDGQVVQFGPRENIVGSITAGTQPQRRAGGADVHAIGRREG